MFRSHFIPDESLRNIDSYIPSADNVNMDKVKAIGPDILLSMIMSL